MKVQRLDDSGKLVDVDCKVTLICPLYNDLTWSTNKAHDAKFFNSRKYKKAIILTKGDLYNKTIVSVWTGAIWAIFQAEITE